MLAYSYRRSREIGADREVDPALHRIQDAFLITYGAMLQQGKWQELVEVSLLPTSSCVSQCGVCWPTQHTEAQTRNSIQ